MAPRYLPSPTWVKSRGKEFASDCRDIFVRPFDARNGMITGSSGVETGDTGNAVRTTGGTVEGVDGTEDALTESLGVGKSDVEAMIEENGGRMWQTEIVDRVDVSSSTVSRWLCDMEADERIHRVQLGRRNVVMLPGESLIDPDPGAASPDAFE